MANQYISKKLKDARKAAGFTQRDIYEWLGIGQSTFSAWETGQGEPSVEVFLMLCKKYQINDIAGYFLPDPKTGRTVKQLDPVFVNKMLSLPKRSRDAVINCLEYEYSVSAVKIHMPRTLRVLPLFTQTATAGLGNYLDDSSAEWCEMEAPDEADFAITISGNSMEPLISDGTVVFVHRQAKLISGEIGIFSYNGESFCKMLENRNGILRLVSMNKDYAPMLLRQSDSLVIHGKVLI